MSGNRGVPLSARPQCPHGEDCGCTVLTRHEWYSAYCKGADATGELRKELAATKHALVKALAVPRPRLLK